MALQVVHAGLEAVAFFLGELIALQKRVHLVEQLLLLALERVTVLLQPFDLVGRHNAVNVKHKSAILLDVGRTQCLGHGVEAGNFESKSHVTS